MGDSKDCINIGFFEWKPYASIQGGPGNQSVSGTMLDVFDIITKDLQVCYNAVVPLDFTGGGKLPNGSWTGLVGLLVDKKIDVAGLGLAMNEERKLVMEVSEYLYYDAWTAGYVRPGLDSDVAGFIKPLTLEVWVGLLLSSVAALLVATGVRLFENKILLQWGLKPPAGDSSSFKKFPEDVPEDDPALKKSFEDSFNDATLWTVAPLLSQSIASAPKGDVVRFLCCIWLLMTLTVGNVYRSNLKAKIILPKVSLPFNNYDEMERSGVPVWMPKYSSVHRYIMNSPKTSTFGLLQDQLAEHKGSMSLGRAVQGMVDGDHALVAPRTAIMQILHDTFSKTGRCTTYMISQAILSQPTLLAFPIGSPWAPKFNKRFVRLREAGILDHVFMKGVSNATECLKPISHQGSDALKSMKLGDFYGTLAVYAGGAIMASISFAVEMLLGGKTLLS